MSKAGISLKHDYLKRAGKYINYIRFKPFRLTFFVLQKVL